MSMCAAFSGGVLLTSGRRSASPLCAVRKAPAVKYVLPPAQLAGHLSMMTTRALGFACAAERAAEKPALPLPMTRTSQVDGGGDIVGVADDDVDVM